MPKPTRERIQSAIDAMLHHDPKVYPARVGYCVDEIMHVIEGASYGSALQRIADADLKRASAGYLQSIAAEALK